MIEEEKDFFDRMREKHPQMFNMQYGSFVSFGVGAGWEPIVEEAMEKLSKIEGITICQVKEKFGGMRIYLNGTCDEANAIIRDAEKKASTVCEECGSTHNVSAKGGWIKTYCEECHLRSELAQANYTLDYWKEKVEGYNELVCDIRVAAKCNRDFGECACVYCQAKDKVK